MQPAQDNTQNTKFQQPTKPHYKNKNSERAAVWNKKFIEKRRARMAVWRGDNVEKNRAYQRKYKVKLKNLILNHYGRECACCGEDHIEFLCLDHLDGNGNQHRKATGNKGGHQFYQWVVNNNYPEGLRILCHNCNQSLNIWGYCPHNKL